MSASRIPPDWRERPVLRRATVAALSSLSTRTLDRMIARGEIASRKVGRVRMIPIAAVLELLGEPAVSNAPALPDIPALPPPTTFEERQALADAERILRKRTLGELGLGPDTPAKRASNLLAARMRERRR